MIKHKVIKLVLQILVIIVVSVLIIYLIITMLGFRAYNIPFYGAASIEEPNPSDDMQIVATKYNEDVVLNKKAIISSIIKHTDTVLIPDTYNSCVSVGEVINSGDVLATNGNDNICSPILGRVISISGKDNVGEYHIEIDPFSNYEIMLILQFDEANIYFGLRKNDIDSIDIIINGYTSQAKVAECYFENNNQVFIIKIRDFSFNPYIFDKYIVNVYKLIEKGEELLLFPKICFYTLLDKDAIKAKKVIYDDAGNAIVQEVILKIVAELSDDDYLFVKNASENAGLYVVAKER